MSQISQIRTYERDASVVFRKTREAFGGLSNMAAGFPIDINGRRYRTSEVLYQACRYPHMPEVQELVVSQRSPMTAKMKSRPYRKDSRSDWDQVRVATMKWCLRAKLLQNWRDFSALLLETGERPIVEESGKDAFWGAKPKENGTLEGTNVLGRLLMELREKLKNNPESLRRVAPVPIPNFLLFDKPVPVLEGDSDHAKTYTGCHAKHAAADLFSSPTEPKENQPASEIEESSDMTNTYKKKLIEVAIPLEAINLESTKEKNNPFTKGHPRALHQWWARRPNVGCRALLIAQLLNDPSSEPEKFETEERQEEERQRLFKLIADAAKWKNNSNIEILENVTEEIKKSCGGNIPKIYDPFSGGCAIPIEAQRLGLRSIGSDLNPIAVTIGKASIEIAPRFAGREPIHSTVKDKLNYTGNDGIAEDVAYYGNKVHERAKKILDDYYPDVSVSSDGEIKNSGVIGWIWTRTVPSPDPAYQGIHVPIASTFALCTKKDKEAYLEVNVDKSTKSYEFKVKHGRGPSFDVARAGTKQGRGANFTCILSGAAITSEYVKSQGKNNEIKQKLIAIVTQGKGNTKYFSPNSIHENIALSLNVGYRLGQKIANDRRSMFTPLYGLKNFNQLFTDRQFVALIKINGILRDIKSTITSDAKAAGMKSTGERLREGGDGAEAYAEAISVYLALCFSKLLDYGNSIVSWNLTNQNATHLFTKQAIPMSWDFFELNPIGRLMNFSSISSGIAKAISQLPYRACGEEYHLDAISGIKKIQFDAVNTDPPYYDNIGYADLSDFFYVWQRQVLKDVFPELFGFLSTPKAEEMVALTYRHETKSDAEAFFLQQMKYFFECLAANSSDDFPSVIYYAFKQSEIEKDGITSAGWASFLQAILDAGLQIVATWPVRTERQARTIGLGNNALAGSVVLVCRKRGATALTISRAEFIRLLKKELPLALVELQSVNIAPADMPQSSIGPGMGIFSRYTGVLEADDTPMSVKVALQLINRESDEFLNEIQGEFDADTRFALTWFEQNGFTKGDFGIANSIAQVRGIAVESVKHAGIVESLAGKVRILKRDELLDDWEPSTDTHLTIWECCQYLVRALENGGEEAAALLIKKLGSDKAEAVKDLAYCLYDICSNKRSDAKEATAYNALIAVWADLTRMAATIHDVRGDGQTSLNL